MRAQLEPPLCPWWRGGPEFEVLEMMTWWRRGALSWVRGREMSSSVRAQRARVTVTCTA